MLGSWNSKDFCAAELSMEWIPLNGQALTENPRRAASGYLT